MKNLRNISSSLMLGAVSVAVGMGLNQSAVAQSGDRAGIEEIIVTGTKREVSAQDVPIAVTAISEEMLRNQQRNDILAIGEMSPGVALGQVAGFRAIAGGIRGTGQNSILVTQDSSVVLLVDEFALSNVQSQFVELFDIERVEVYRGPQGTLFGKSATGGAISIVTKRPEMNEFGADMSFRYGTFDADDGDTAAIKKYSAAINVPLIEDQLSMRLVGIWDEDDGYYTNDKDTAVYPDSFPIFGGGPAPVLPGISTQTRGSGENLNNTDVFAGKVKLLWQPMDNYEAYLMFDYLDDDSGSPPGVNESEPDMLLPLLGFPSIQAAGLDGPYSTGVTNQCVGGNPNATCITAGHRVNVKGVALHQTLDFSDYTAKVILAHRNQRERLPSTYTGEAFTSLFDATRNTTRIADQYELRLSSNYDGPFNFLGGYVHTKEDVKMLSYATVGLTGVLTGDTDFLTDPAMGGAEQDRKTNAVYGDATYEFTDRFSVTAGVRWTKDKKDFFRRANPGGPCTARTPLKDESIINGECLDARSNAVSRVGAGFTSADLRAYNLPLPNSAFGIAAKANDDWQKTTYRLVAQYDVLDDSMVYLSYATGFIPGGFTETCSSPETCQAFDSETNWNAETGFKGQFMDGSVQTNVAIYYTEYKDLIRSQVVPFTNVFGVTTQETINVNAGKSKAYGFEGEGTWLPIENLELRANVAYLKAEYKDFDLNGQDLSNLDVPFSPEWKYGISATYFQELSIGSLAYNVNVSHQDENEFSVFNSPLTQMDERTLWGANVTFRDPEDKYFLTLWGLNLTDETYRTAANSVAGLWNFTMYGRPRSYGMEFGVSF